MTLSPFRDADGRIDAGRLQEFLQGQMDRLLRSAVPLVKIEHTADREATLVAVRAQLDRIAHELALPPEEAPAERVIIDGVLALVGRAWDPSLERTLANLREIQTLHTLRRRHSRKNRRRGRMRRRGSIPPSGRASAG